MPGLNRVELIIISDDEQSTEEALDLVEQAGEAARESRLANRRRRNVASSGRHDSAPPTEWASSSAWNPRRWEAITAASGVEVISVASDSDDEREALEIVVAVDEDDPLLPVPLPPNPYIHSESNRSRSRPPRPSTLMPWYQSSESSPDLFSEMTREAAAWSSAARSFDLQDSDDEDKADEEDVYTQRLFAETALQYENFLLSNPDLNRTGRIQSSTVGGLPPVAASDGQSLAERSSHRPFPPPPPQPVTTSLEEEVAVHRELLRSRISTLDPNPPSLLSATRDLRAPDVPDPVSDFVDPNLRWLVDDTIVGAVSAADETRGEQQLMEIEITSQDQTPPSTIPDNSQSRPVNRHRMRRLDIMAAARGYASSHPTTQTYATVAAASTISSRIVRGSSSSASRGTRWRRSHERPRATQTVLQDTHPTAALASLVDDLNAALHAELDENGVLRNRTVSLRNNTRDTIRRLDRTVVCPNGGVLECPCHHGFTRAASSWVQFHARPEDVWDQGTTLSSWPVLQFAGDQWRDESPAPNPPPTFRSEYRVLGPCR